MFEMSDFPVARAQGLRSNDLGPDEILAARFDGCLEHIGIGRGEIGRRQRIDKLTRIKLRFAGGVRIDALDATNRRLHVLGEQQVALLHEVEEGFSTETSFLKRLSSGAGVITGSTG